MGWGGVGERTLQAGLGEFEAVAAGSLASACGPDGGVGTGVPRAHCGCRPGHLGDVPLLINRSGPAACFFRKKKGPWPSSGPTPSISRWGN